MDLTDKILEIWCQRYSKGIWITKDGKEHYIEMLEDNHIMRLPYFLKKKYHLEFIEQLPDYLVAEITERDMLIDPETFYVTRKEKPIIIPEPIEENNITVPKKSTNRNRNLFNRLRR